MTRYELTKQLNDWMDAWDELPPNRPGLARWLADHLIENGLVAAEVGQDLDGQGRD